MTLLFFGIAWLSFTAACLRSRTIRQLRQQLADVTAELRALRGH